MCFFCYIDMKAEIIIPTSLDEIPLKHYQEFIKVFNSGSDETFIAEKMVQIFCGLKLSDVIKIKSTDVFDLVQTLNNLFNDTPKFQHRFTIGDIEFGFIPDFENISLGEYVDLEKYIVDIETMHKAMAVMYRPIVEKTKDKYNIIEYTGTEEFSDVMKFAPLSIVLGANVFFWTLRNDLLNALTTYLEVEAKKMSLANDTNSVNNGDGTAQSINLQMEMLRDLMKLPEQGYLSALHFLHTNHN